MKRKEFLSKTLQLGVTSGSMLLLAGGKATACTSGPARQDQQDRDQEFLEHWMTTLMELLEQQLNEDQRNALMHSCGRACARREAIGLAARFAGDVKGMVENFAQNMGGPERIFLDANTVHMDFDGCFCPLVDEGPEVLPDTFCECSKGWMLEMFETAAQKPVQVEILQTVRRGDPTCGFLIHV